MKSKIFFMSILVCGLIATFCGTKRGVFAEQRQRQTEGTIVSKEEPITESTTRPDAEIQPEQEPKLRRAFLSKDTHSDYAGIIGRLAILLENRTVPVETIFHVGDKIKFEVTSNRDGWIYIFHRPPKGELALLWPGKDLSVSKNFVTQHQPKIIPDQECIEFYNEIGNETFYIAIVPEPKAPPIGAEKSEPYQKAKKRHNEKKHQNAMAQETTNQREQQTVKDTGAEEQIAISETEGLVVRKQIAVRGIEQLSKRGVKLRPDDGDIYLYFSIKPGDGEDVAAITFQLRHE